MARRSKQLNVWKIAWEWAESTEPGSISQANIETVYRVGVPPCSEGQCRKNCKANPNCLKNLGEKLWFGDIKDEYWLSNAEDPETERRVENEFVGLRNLGATCYVNTFLQLWFHNHALRSALYACAPEESLHPSVIFAPKKTENEPAPTEVVSDAQPADDKKEHKVETTANANEPTQACKSPKIPLLPSMVPLDIQEEPKSVYGHLQLLFAQLQYSARRYIDPMVFINSLGLNTAQQQDAQEFSKLFMSLLEETLSNQPDPEVQHVVQKQFGGDYYYVTRCSNCGTASKRLSRFYELDLNIQGHSSLNQCIKEFLKEEKLDGENQYFCAQCNNKQNAARYIELNTLPPILNLQLLRFVFDRKTGYKKKLNSISQFPDLLNMRDYLQNDSAGSGKIKMATPQRSKVSVRNSPKNETPVRREATPTVRKTELPMVKKQTIPLAQKTELPSVNKETVQFAQETDLPLVNKEAIPFAQITELSSIKNGTVPVAPKTDLQDSSLSNTTPKSKEEEKNAEKRSSNEEEEQLPKTPQSETGSRRKKKWYLWWAEGQAGIVESWGECHQLISNKKQSSCKRFNSLEKAAVALTSKLKEIKILREIRAEKELTINQREEKDETKQEAERDSSDPAVSASDNKPEYSDEDNEFMYELRAVLVHHGPSAYSGHYVAHIKDSKSGSWYKFNDEEIEKIKGKLKLSVDEEVAETGSKPAKRTKVTKGFHTSKNAYMLVYTRQNWGTNDSSELQAPASVQELVAKDNSRFESWISEVNSIRDSLVREGRKRQSEIQHIYKLLPADQDFEWICTKWLREWMNEKQDHVPPVDNSSLLCSHGRLNPDNVQQAKKISCKAADLIFAKYGGLPRLKSDCLCFECVKERCSRIRFQSKLTADHKFVSETMKASPESTRLFWVGKMSLHNWRGLASRLYEEQHASNSLPVQNTEDPDGEADKSEIENSENGEKQTTNGTDRETVGDSEGNTPEVMPDVDESGRREFNEELLCRHGCLSNEESGRRLVPEGVWERLKQYFPSACEFGAEWSICSKCKADEEEERMRIELFKAMASEQKIALNALYYDKQRPQMDLVEKEPAQVYVVSKEFLDEWRQFLRFPTRCSRPTFIDNSSLLCPHSHFLFDPQVAGVDGAAENLCYVFDYEWEALCRAYPHDHAIMITREIAEGQDTKLVSLPACCEECHTALMYEQARLGEDFRQAKIYVRKVTEDHSEKEINQILAESPSSNKDTQDPDFSGSACKKPRLSDGATGRRSARHRKQRGEIDLRVDSSLTLKKLKLELMKPFSVMPLDQHLSLNGTPLNDDAATLGRLGIRPGCLLLLKVDEPQGSEVMTEDMVQGALLFACVNSNQYQQKTVKRDKRKKQKCQELLKKDSKGFK